MQKCIVDILIIIFDSARRLSDDIHFPTFLM